MIVDENLFVLRVEPYAKAYYWLEVVPNGDGGYRLMSRDGRHQKLILGTFGAFMDACDEAKAIKDREEAGRLD